MRLGEFTFARSGRPPWRPDSGIAALIGWCMFRLLAEPLATGGQRYRLSEPHEPLVALMMSRLWIKQRWRIVSPNSSNVRGKANLRR